MVQVIVNLPAEGRRCQVMQGSEYYAKELKMKSCRQPTSAAVIVSLITFFVFLGSLSGEFINFDDPEYVLNNPVIRELRPANLAAMFSQSHVGWWMPLTWLSLAIDYHFWGLNPVGYHLTNILLHAVNAGIVALIAACFCRMALTDGESYARVGSNYYAALIIAGLFFGAHPLRVESVAWVTERKDVLNGFFAFTTVLFYLLYVERTGKTGKGRQSTTYYLLALLCFICSLMSKSISVVLPAMLLAIDWAPLGRLRRNSLRQLLLEKTPFLAASALITLFTFYFAAQSRYLVTYDAFPFAQRLVVSGNAIWEYVRMLLVPVGLSPFNVIPDPIPAAYSVKSVLVAVVLGLIAFTSISPWIKSATLCFLLPLFPVLAFFQNGDQSYADRFTYLPSLSPAIFLALFLYTSPRFGGDVLRRRLVVTVASLVMVVFMVATYRQLDVWRSTETFWTRIIAVEPLAIVYKERGRYYHAAGRYSEAVADFTAALEMMTPTLKPYEYNFFAFRAESLRAAGMFADAVLDFDTAIGLHPHPVYYFHRGLALRAMGRNVEADEDLRRAGTAPGSINWFD